jgi:hypothetical protein
MKVYKGSRGIALLILNLKKWRRLVNATPRPLYHRTDPQYPLNRRLGGIHSRSERSWTRIPHRPARSLVTIPNAQYRLPIFWSTLTNSRNPEKNSNSKIEAGMQFQIRNYTTLIPTRPQWAVLFNKRFHTFLHATVDDVNGIGCVQQTFAISLTACNTVCNQPN